MCFAILLIIWANGRKACRHVRLGLGLVTAELIVTDAAEALCSSLKYGNLLTIDLTEPHFIWGWNF